MSEATYPLHKWRWRVADPLRPGKTYLTRHHMTEAEALAMDPAAQREPLSLLVIQRPGQAHGSGDHGRIS